MHLLLLLACGPGSVSVDPGDDKPARPDDTAAPDTDDTDIEHIDTDDTDSGDTEETGDTGEADTPRFTPDAGTFVDPFDVTVALEEGEQAWYTTDGSLPGDTDTPYTAPITVRDSVELRVLVRDTDGEERFYARSYVRLDVEVAGFDSNLPLVLVSADGNLDGAASDYLPVSFQVHDVGDDGRAALLGEATMSHRAAVKHRGSSTIYDPKHSYALELRETYDDTDDAESLLGMPAAADWVLYAPLDFDRALIRNALMYQLSNDLGRYAPRTRFVEVYAVGRGGAVGEGDYQGVYVLMERIEAAPDRVAITPVGPADVALPELSGGYLFKRDRVGEGESGFDAGTIGVFSFQDPLVYVDPDEDEIVPVQISYLADVIDGFAYALVAPDHTHEGVHYRDRIDVDAWIDNHLLHLFAKNPDGLRLSSHMYKDRDGPIVAGPVWDFDRALNATSDDRARNPTWWDATNQTWDTTAMFTYGWYEPLFDDPEFATAYWARLDALLGDTLSVAHVHGVIDEMAAELSEAAPRNYDRWDDYSPRAGGLDAEIAALKDWVEARHTWMTGCLATWPDDPEACRGE